MSIWSSVPGEDVLALDGHDDDANYGGTGEPVLAVGVATARSFHSLIRLSIDGDATDVCALLTADGARELARQLRKAAGE